MGMQEMEAHLGKLEGAYVQVADRLNSIDLRLDSIDRRFENIDRRFENIDRRFESLDRRLESLDRRFESLDRRFEGIDRQFHALRGLMDQRFMWTLGLGASAWLTTILAVVLHR